MGSFDLGERVFGGGKLGNSSGADLGEQSIQVTTDVKSDEFTQTSDGNIQLGSSAVLDTLNDNVFTQTFDGSIVSGVLEQFVEDVFTETVDGDSILVSAVSFNGEIFNSIASSEPGVNSINGTVNSVSFDIVHRTRPITAGVPKTDAILGEERLGETSFSGTPIIFGEAFTEGSSVPNVPLSSAAVLDINDDDTFTQTFDGSVVLSSASIFVGDPFTSTIAETTNPLVAAIFPEVFRYLPSWAIGTRVIGQTLEEVREWQLLEVTLRYGEEDEQFVREILSKSGKGNILEDPSGGFKTIDTGVNNDIEFNAPSDRRELRTVDTWYLDDYDKELVNRDGTVYDVTFELIPNIEKSFDNEYGSFESEPTDTQQTSLWYFDFEFGSFATNRVSIATEEVGDGTTDVIEMNLILKEDEARIIEENASYLNSVFLREIPDNADRLDDTSEDTRQTVDITPPNGRDEPIPADSYVIRTWETEWKGNVFNVAMEVGRE